MYCPECGLDHHAAERAEAEEVQRIADREVEIERLRTKRDIEVARITAGAAKDIAEEEAGADLAHAEGRAEGMEDVIDAVAGGGNDEPPAEPEPLVIDAPEPGPAVDDDAPPPAEEHHDETPPRSRGLGMW